MINPLPIVRAELRRTRAATLAAVALVAVAVALGVAVTAQERALRAGTALAAEPFDVLIGARGSPIQLVLSTVYLQPAALDLLSDPILARLDAEAGIAWAAPIVFGDSYRGFPVIGTTAVLATHGGTSPLGGGRAFQSAGEAVVGADIPLRLDERFSPTHGEARGADHEGVEHGSEYTVVGVRRRLGTPWDRAILVPVEAVWRIHARPNGHAPGTERIGPPWNGEVSPVSAVVIKAASVADAYRLRARHRTPSTMALFPAEVLVELYGTLGDARDVLSVIALVTQALVVAAVVGLGLGWQAAVALSRLLQARTGVVLAAGIARPELGLIAGVVAVGAALALVPAWLACRQSVSSLLRG